jgi:HEAT repeat protein
MKKEAAAEMLINLIRSLVMKYKKAVTIIAVLFVLASSCADAMTIDESIEKLKTHKFGQNNEVLDFLYDTAIKSHSNPELRKELKESLMLILASDAAYDAKQFACRQLALTATAEHIPVLAKHLTDEKMSHMALYVLTHIDSPEVDKALLASLDKASGRARLGIINMLGNRRCLAADTALGKLAASPDAQVAVEAAKALGRIGSESAGSILQKALADGEHPAGDVLPEACLLCGDRFLEQRHTRAAASLYEAVFTSSSPAHIRAAALKCLAEALGKQVAPFVAQSLKSDNKHLYGMAAVIVRNAADKKTAEAMVAGLGSFQPAVQVLLINALAARDDGAAINIIKDACQSDSVAVRSAALGALGKIGDESTIALLVKHADEGVDEEQAAAMESLAGLRGKNVNSTLAKLLSTSSNRRKVVICRALLKRDASEAAPALIKAARTGDHTVRTESLKALRDLAGEQEIPSLVDLIFFVEPTQADQVGKTLASVARRNSVHQQCTENILSKLNQAKNDKQRVALITTLGGLGHELALPVLRRGLQDKSSEIRYASIKALSAWPNTDAAEDLLKVGWSTTNKTHRVLALRGYIDLIDASELPAGQKLESYKEAMELADQDAERKKVLSVLAALDTLEAFRMAASRLDEPSLKNEAALAACMIAEKIYTTKGRQIKGDLEKIMEGDIGDSRKQQAGEILQNISKLKYYVMDWEVSGPYTQDGKNYSALFDIPFSPEIDGGKGARWRTMPTGTDSGQPWYLDLLKALNGGEQRVAYLRTKLQWPSEQQVKLWIGSDDGNKVWVNGKLVHANNVARPFAPDQENATVTLKKGENVILMKITQNNLPWGASLRIEEPKPPKPAQSGEGFKLHVINGDSDFEAAGVLDINRDGRADIFCGGFCYEAPTWKKHFVREAPKTSEYYNDFANLPMDVDGDGWTDIVNAAFFNKRLFWIRNPGKSGGGFEVIDIDQPGNMETAIAADINGDGQQDILPNIGGSAAWYEFKRDASAKYGVKWIKHDLPKEAAAHGIGAGDINGDGRCDVVAPSGWAEQPAEAGAEWLWHGEFNLGSTSIPILVHDVDGDGDGDIIWGMGHDYGIYWLEQTAATGGGRSWRRHEIDRSWSQPHFLLLADLNGDGDDEMVTGKRYRAHNGGDPGGNDPLCVYYYSFDSKAKKWSRHLLHEGGRVGFGINTQATDIDGDGDVDIAAPGKSGLYLFENTLK